MLDFKSQRMVLERDTFTKISSLLEKQETRSTFNIIITPSWKLDIYCSSKERSICLNKSIGISWSLVLRDSESYILFSDNNSKIFLEQSIDYQNIPNMDDSHLILSYGKDPLYLGNIPNYVLAEVIKNITF